MSINQERPPFLRWYLFSDRPLSTGGITYVELQVQRWLRRTFWAMKMIF
jgi:hypothetical protein